MLELEQRGPNSTFTAVPKFELQSWPGNWLCVVHQCAMLHQLDGRYAQLNPKHIFTAVSYVRASSSSKVGLATGSVMYISVHSTCGPPPIQLTLRPPYITQRVTLHYTVPQPSNTILHYPTFVTIQPNNTTAKGTMDRDYAWALWSFYTAELLVSSKIPNPVFEK